MILLFGINRLRQKNKKPLSISQGAFQIPDYDGKLLHHNHLHGFDIIAGD